MISTLKGRKIQIPVSLAAGYGTPMEVVMRPLFVFFFISTPALAGTAVPDDAAAGAELPHAVLLDGVQVPAEWDDGDTFAVLDESGHMQRMRLKGYNTLESYGPVHRWGGWTALELYALAKKAGEVAGGQVWACTLQQGEGGYGRKIADCPELRHSLLSSGLAHVFTIDAEPDPTDLALQQQAITDKVGMWAKGAPTGLITSLHSLDEKANQTATYNRVASLTTGMAEANDHSETYTTCQEVCVGAAPPEGDGSCMVYVPYKQRYHDQPDCLKTE